MSFPKLPGYRYSWRSLQLEPISLSSERITVGIIVKGQDERLIAAKLLPRLYLKKIYGGEFGKRVAEAATLCIRHAEKYYEVNPLSTSWAPPLDGFFLNEIKSSVAEDADQGMRRAALDCSSFSYSMEIDKLAWNPKRELSAPESWRKRVLAAVSVENEALTPCFERSVEVLGSSAPLKFGFLSSNYAAQFDVVGSVKQVQRSLARVQGKLWQLDRLRDEHSLLFRPTVYELVLEKPSAGKDRDTMLVDEFLEKLRQEASRRNIGLYATESPEDAARHLIEITA